MAESKGEVTTNMRLLHDRGSTKRNTNVNNLGQLISIGGDNIHAILVIREDGDIDVYAGPGRDNLNPKDDKSEPGVPVRHNGVTVSRMVSVFGSPGCVEINGKEYCD